MGKPNVIFILSDEHRGMAMSHLGDENVRTPGMDKLASEGVSFSRAYCNCPICTPSRGTIFSGRHAHSGPVSGFFDVYKAAAPSLATILRENGYHTAYFGKWHCGGVRDQRGRLVRDNPDIYTCNPYRTPERHRAGFQDWFGYECINKHFEPYIYMGKDKDPTLLKGYEADVLTDLAIDYIKNYKRDEPFFLVLSINPPHFPLEVPSEFDTFDREKLILRPNFNPDTPVERENLAIYYAMIQNLDQNIGRLNEYINENIEDTLVIYTSDHGEFMGSHGRSRRKEHPHEESISIPAIFKMPDTIKRDSISTELFSSVDIVPTICGLLDIKIPDFCQGMDFSPLLNGSEEFKGPEKVLIEMVNNPRWNLDFLDWRGFVSDKYKYCFYEDGSELLFNLEKDPYEIENLAYKNAELREKMKKDLLELLLETREPFFDVIINYGHSMNEKDIDVSIKE
jgi:arylsulfatase A-like enzyme